MIPEKDGGVGSGTDKAWANALGAEQMRKITTFLGSNDDD